MRATGIIRRVDDLGRVVIPKEVRRAMKMREGEPLEIYTDYARGEVIFKKYENDDFKPVALNIVSALRATKIPCGVYNRDGEKVAGSGRDEIDVDFRSPCVFPIPDDDIYGGNIGYVVVAAPLSDVDFARVETLVMMASFSLTR
jgi:AbrB family looped-hinge helix DNA binding protein